MSWPDDWLRADPQPYGASERIPVTTTIAPKSVAPSRAHTLVVSADGSMTQVDVERGTPYDFAVENRRPYRGTQYGERL
jgi:hypothetical protein